MGPPLPRAGPPSPPDWQDLAPPAHAAHDPAALEAGRHLFAQACTFKHATTRAGDLPAPDLVEIAFAGRSNVGKSSLINALTGQTALARTSNTPGRTRSLNFFDLGGKVTIVDLPGYGYAKAPKGEIRQWTRLIDDYLKGRANLMRACILVDARHGIKESDRTVFERLDGAAVPYQAVLTKADKLSGEAIRAVHEKMSTELRRHPAAFPTIAVTSARSGLGIENLRADLAALVAGARIG